MTINHIKYCKEHVLAGGRITIRDAAMLMETDDADLPHLASAADAITRRFHGDLIDVEQLANIKKNACSEDCTFCGQSALYDTGIPAYHLPEPGEILARAQEAARQGAGSYCLVAAWRQPSEADFAKVCQIIRLIKSRLDLDIECSLGFLNARQAAELYRLGVKRYNHNLETARSKFAQICTTHTYDDRLKTLAIARDAGLELCTGGIIGLGETRGQRMELAAELSRLSPEEVTINMLVSVPGTPMELQADLAGPEILRMFAIVRFLLPHSILKISGGREAKLQDSGRRLLMAGANGIITGGYLTMDGNRPQDDRRMIREIGLQA